MNALSRPRSRGRACPSRRLRSGLVPVLLVLLVAPLTASAQAKAGTPSAGSDATDAESLPNPLATETRPLSESSEPDADPVPAPEESSAPSDGQDAPDELDELDELDDFDLQSDIYGMPDVPDPIEPVNRVVFRFNRELDRWVMDPITRAYGFVLPEFAKTGVRNFFLNLDGPVVMLNDMLQLEWKDAGVTGSRFVINTTIGVVGVWDPAVRMGLPWHHSDFGQTLALAGSPSGPYLILPLLGPTTLRDGVGVGVDVAFSPLTWLIGPIELIGLGGASGISVREAHLESLRALERGSVDFYATFRNAYTQNRRAEIWSRREDRLPRRIERGASEQARSE